MADLDIFLVSGGSGTTGSAVLRACLAQFPERDVRIWQECPVTSGRVAEAIVSRAAAADAVICHTLVDPAIRQVLVSSSLAAGLPCIDLLGPTLSVLGERLLQEPLGKAGLLAELHREQFDRMDAVDFTLAHDDGQRLHELDRADVVLLGLSRVSKSVTCFYLASRGVRAANVPLLNNVPLPSEVLDLDPRRVFVLNMNAAHLSAVRQARLDRIAANRSVADYTDIREINREIRYVESLRAEHHWKRIDVSYKATEEAASEIMDSLAGLHSLSRDPASNHSTSATSWKSPE